jgi:hypothetical protein
VLRSERERRVGADESRHAEETPAREATQHEIVQGTVPEADAAYTRGRPQSSIDVRRGYFPVASAAHTARSSAARSAWKTASGHP